MKSRLTIFLTVLALLLVSASGAWASNGIGQTPLAIQYTATGVCEADGTTTVTLSFTVTSGNTSGGSINWSFGNDTGSISIAAGLTTDDPAGDWVAASSGPVKTFTTTVTLSGIQNGQYDGEAIVSQTGGNYDDQSSTLATFTANCTATETCDQFSQVVGQVTNNKNLSKNVTPVNFTIKGAFGDNAVLTITPANSSTVVYSIGLTRDGSSCVYRTQWIPAVAAGTYTATVTGNNQTPLVFNFDISFKK